MNTLRQSNNYTIRKSFSISSYLIIFAAQISKRNGTCKKIYNFLANPNQKQSISKGFSLSKDGVMRSNLHYFCL